ncbi:histone acetylation protein-domain-containing protein [Mycena latifolia]|nr:histone acetylation protein-domain-containing protein [Mycena latifolia]
MTVSLQSTFGSAFVGLIASAVLYGVTILQTNYPNDSKILKWMVAILWVLILNFNNPAILTSTTWSMNVQTDFNVSRNIFLTLVIFVLSIIHFGVWLFLRWREWINNEVLSFIFRRMRDADTTDTGQWVTSAGLGSAAACDMLIGISLCYYLSKSRTGFSRTDNLISTLMTYSLTTGFLTGIVACLVVVTFATMPDKFVYVAFIFLSGKCGCFDWIIIMLLVEVILLGYVNSVLAALSRNRESLRERAHHDGSFLNLSGFPSGALTVPSRRKLTVTCLFMASTASLRDHLLNGLRDIPGTREFHIHVLVSSPRKFQGLFPFAQPRPRSYLQDILVLLSEQSTPDSPRVFTTAIEACVHNVPATSCAIFYVSKVDTTGQSTSPSPTAALVRSLLIYYADPATRPVSADHLWIHLFARAQSQYLFPNSADYSGKHPLSDVKLCAWWKRVLTEVAHAVSARESARADAKCVIKLYYVLPGYSQLEAEHSLQRAAASSADAPPGTSWTYGHPYSQTEIPLPCPAPTPDPHHNLGHFIPSFDDDPKSRFMDEIGCTPDAEGIRSPPRKRLRTVLHSNDADTPREAAAEKERQGGKEQRILGELGTVSPDEFWERMSFRQECVAGAVTGFFVAGISCPSSQSAPAISPLAPLPGQVSCQLNKRVLSSLMTGLEFSTLERSVKATETLEGAIRGLCEGIATIPAPRTHIRDSDRRTPEPEPSRALLAPPSTPPRRGNAYVADVSPNPFPEPVTSLETYHSHIYGSICVSNAARPPQTHSGAGDAGASTEPGPQVTVLAVRKKKKRVD